MLAQVPDPRKRRGRRYSLVFVLAVAVGCVLAGAKNFREIGDQAADLPQDVLARLGGRPSAASARSSSPARSGSAPCSRPSTRRRLDEITGGWLRALADAGKLEPLLTAIAIDGKWLRGIGDGQQVKLFAAMLHEEKVIIAQHAIPEGTNEITQVKELLDAVDLDERGRHRRRRPRPARHRGLHRGAGRRRRPGRGLLPARRACFTLLLLLVMACQTVQPGRVRPGYAGLCGVRG